MLRPRTALHPGFLVIALVLVFSRDVHAYLDPGTGSLVFQTVAAALAAAVYVISSYWNRIRTIFGAREPASPIESNDTQA